MAIGQLRPFPTPPRPAPGPWQAADLEALEEWRSAAACARGRFRPDGYGCYRRGTSRFGFFLEFDRGTEKPREYAAKLAAYYRYRDAGMAAHDYTGFPTLLVVTTRAAAEARFAYQAYLAHERRGSTPLLVFLTTTSRIDNCRDGVLGPIWRSPAEPWADDPAGPIIKARIARSMWKAARCLVRASGGRPVRAPRSCGVPFRATEHRSTVRRKPGAALSSSPPQPECGGPSSDTGWRCGAPQSSG